MARFEILDSNMAPLGEGPASPDMLFELGMMYSVGRDAPVDLVSAHKWFNLAAVKGNTEAIRLRREIANQMSDAEIAVAQRAARDWLRNNAAAPMPAYTRCMSSNISSTCAANDTVRSAFTRLTTAATSLASSSRESVERPGVAARRAVRRNRSSANADAQSSHQSR